MPVKKVCIEEKSVDFNILQLLLFEVLVWVCCFKCRAVEKKMRARLGTRFGVLLLIIGQWRRKRDVDSISEPQLQSEFQTLSELCLNLCSWKWLTFRLIRMIPSGMRCLWEISIISSLRETSWRPLRNISKEMTEKDGGFLTSLRRLKKHLKKMSFLWRL